MNNNKNLDALLNEACKICPQLFTGNDPSLQLGWIRKHKASLLTCLLAVLLNDRDGAAKLALTLLPNKISPKKVSTDGKFLRLWESCGLFYFLQGHFHEALSIFHSLYEHMLAHQNKSDTRVNMKGTPLVWIGDCHWRMGNPVLAKRYHMLHFCEDNINRKGKFTAGGADYFRMASWHGLPDQMIRNYAKQAYAKYKNEKEPQAKRFPEWILKNLDPEQRWMTEHPSLQETAIYSFNTEYVQWLTRKLGDKTGKTLERLAHYLLSCVPGFRAHVRKPSESTEYDVLCANEGPAFDFRSELGRYFACECKDWARRADFSAVAKFCQVLDSAKCHFGIIFSKNGITGVGKTRDAERELLKKFQARGTVIVVFSKQDLKEVANGENFLVMLRKKYEKVRFDLRN